MCGDVGAVVWRVQDDRGRFHGGNLIFLKTTCLVRIKTNNWYILKKTMKKGYTHVLRQSDVGPQLKRQHSCVNTHERNRSKVPIYDETNVNILRGLDELRLGPVSRDLFGR